MGGGGQWVQNIQDKHADQPNKLYVTPYWVQAVGLPQLETTNFHKCTYMQDVLCQVTQHIM